MTFQVDAVYLDGVLRPEAPLALPNGAKVHLAVETSVAAVKQVADGIDPLAAVIGIGDGPESGDVADRHDDSIYGATAADAVIERLRSFRGMLSGLSREQMLADRRHGLP